MPINLGTQIIIIIGALSLIAGFTIKAPSFAQVSEEIDEKTVPSPSYSPTPTNSQPPNEKQPRIQPLPPNTGTPEGRSRPGASRFPSGCPQYNPPLTALIKVDQSFTLSEYPSIFVFIPYAPDEISRMEFIILDERERNTIYHGEVTQAPTPGIIEIQTPQNALYDLTINTSYHWYFKLFCEGERRRGPDLVLDGWLQRISDVANLSDSIDYEVLLEAGLWYDAVSHLASLYAGDPSYQAPWNDLLLNLGYEDISSFPLINSSINDIQ